MSAPSPEQLAELRRVLGLSIGDAILEEALTHRSYAFEANTVHSERLEFLGDAVLEFVITKRLFLIHRHATEKDLSRRRSAVVSTRALAEAAVKYRIGTCLFLGKGEELTGGREKQSLLADAVEALIGAIYIDQGEAEAESFILRILTPLINAAEQQVEWREPKTDLVEFIAAHRGGDLIFSATATGPDHARQYHVDAIVGGRILGSGVAGSKRKAETSAAAQALTLLRADPTLLLADPERTFEPQLRQQNAQQTSRRFPSATTTASRAARIRDSRRG